MAALIVAATLSTGCASASTADGNTASGGQPPSAASQVSLQAAPTSRAVDYTTRGARSVPIPRRFQDVIHLDFAPGNILFATCKPCDDSFANNAIADLDLRSGKAHVVARTKFPHGQTDWVVSSGHRIVYTDQSRIQSDIDRNVRWRVWTLNLKTGVRRLLDTSGNKPNDNLPLPRAGDGLTAWPSAWPGHPGQREFKVYSLRSGKLRTYAQGSKPGDCGLTEGQLFIDAGSRPKRVSLSTGRIQPIKTKPNADAVLAAEGTVVWWSPIGGTGHQIFVAAASNPNHAAEATVNNGLEAPGKGYVAYLKNDSTVETTALDGHTTEYKTPSNFVDAGGIATLGDRLAYLSYKGPFGPHTDNMVTIQKVRSK